MDSPSLLGSIKKEITDGWVNQIPGGLLEIFLRPIDEDSFFDSPLMGIITEIVIRQEERIGRFWIDGLLE